MVTISNEKFSSKQQLRKPRLVVFLLDLPLRAPANGFRNKYEMNYGTTSRSFLSVVIPTVILRSGICQNDFFFFCFFFFGISSVCCCWKICMICCSRLKPVKDPTDGWNSKQQNKHAKKKLFKRQTSEKGYTTALDKDGRINIVAE